MIFQCPSSLKLSIIKVKKYTLNLNSRTSAPVVKVISTYMKH